MRILAAVAALAGISLMAGTNAVLGLGLGLVALAAYLVVAGLTERLERIEQGVEELGHQADVERIHADLARRQTDGAK